MPEEDFRRVKRHVFDPLRSFFTHGKGVPFLFNKIECFLLFFCNLSLGQEEKMEMQKVSSNDDDKISIRKARLI